MSGASAAAGPFPEVKGSRPKNGEANYLLGTLCHLYSNGFVG